MIVCENWGAEQHNEAEFSKGAKMIRVAAKSVFLFLAFFCLAAPPAQAEKIRTSIPGLNLNYLSVFAAQAKGV